MTSVEAVRTWLRNRGMDTPEGWATALGAMKQQDPERFKEVADQIHHAHAVELGISRTELSRRNNDRLVRQMLEDMTPEERRKHCFGRDPLEDESYGREAV